MKLNKGVQITIHCKTPVDRFDPKFRYGLILCVCVCNYCSSCLTGKRFLFLAIEKVKDGKLLTLGPLVMRGPARLPS